VAAADAAGDAIVAGDPTAARALSATAHHADSRVTAAACAHERRRVPPTACGYRRSFARDGIVTG
jgi:hypothetical protein